MGTKIVLLLIILFVVFDNYKRREKILNRVGSEFGNKPKNINDELSMAVLYEYYENRKKEEGDFEEIDKLTWMDLDMDSVFKRTNYTNTTLGEAYLYYKYRKINCDKEKTENIERLVEKFSKNQNLRNVVKMQLSKIGKLRSEEFIKFIYNPKFVKIYGYYKYPLLVLGLILSMISILFFKNIGVILTLFFVCTNILFYQSAKNYLQEDFDIMVYLLKNVQLCESLSKIKDEDFKGVRDKIRDALKKFKDLKKMKICSAFLSSPGVSTGSDLEFLVEYLKMFFMVNVISYQNIVKMLDINKEYLYPIYDLIAEIDFALNIAYYRASIENYCIPEISQKGNIKLENLYHPLLDKPIKNSINIERNILFTGSNASGKSTFIKAIALNCIMAQNLNTALCSKYKGGRYKVITSMAMRDNILEGDSYFVGELKSLKRLLNSLEGSIPVLAFIDEILKGTNTIERISASAAILKYINGTKARLLVATHDIELTKILQEEYNNYHFEEIVTEKDVNFDYKLKRGVATTRNAIKLLGVMDFEKEIVKDANDFCEFFLREGRWTEK